MVSSEVCGADIVGTAKVYNGFSLALVTATRLQQFTFGIIRTKWVKHLQSINLQGYFISFARVWIHYCYAKPTMLSRGIGKPIELSLWVFQ